MSENNDLEVYIYQGNETEEVPRSVEKLVVKEAVEELPEQLCYSFEDLQEVSLPNGLIKIGNRAFGHCKRLSKIKVPSTVEYIGAGAFDGCDLLKQVEFEVSKSLPQRLRFIGQGAFEYSISLSRIKLPPCVIDSTLGKNAFDSCQTLVEADLSATGATKLPDNAFAYCHSLQAISLPNTLKRISSHACYGCSELVTVMLPLDSQPIEIGARAFENCVSLANLTLPKGSTAHRYSFWDCRLLVESYGEDCVSIVAGLVGRFENFILHRMCYDHLSINLQELRQYLSEKQEEILCKDIFGMTPFHVLCSTVEPSTELLEVLLDAIPIQDLRCKDANGNRPLEYLINHRDDGIASLVQTELQKCMIDPFARWSAVSWMQDMESKVEELLAEHDHRRRKKLCHEAYNALEHYEKMESTSILEMALWKSKLAESCGFTNDGSELPALGRDECRFLSGSDVAIPCVTAFLKSPRVSEEPVAASPDDNIFEEMHETSEHIDSYEARRYL